MYLDPTLISWLLLGAASVCAFMVGKNWGIEERDEIIENTILYLIENNFVRAKKVNGEWELQDLDGNK